MKLSPNMLKLAVNGGTYLLELACPAVPAFIWSLLLNAILGGDISITDLTDFMKMHGVKVYSNPEDFPCPSPEPTPNNLGGADDVLADQKENYPS
jgi:hypothetical protein